MNKNYKAALDEAANKSINRNMYELHEADARVRQYKLGADFSFNYQQAEIEKLRAENAAIKAQAEVSSADVDECKFKVFWISADDNGLLDVYRYEPDNHGHQSLKVIDAAALSAMKQTNDMDKAIIDGMRGVVAMARAVNNQRPDPRVTHQLKRFGADKLSDYRDDEIEKLRAENAKLSYALKAMVESAKENNCGLLIADEAISQYDENGNPK